MRQGQQNRRGRGRNRKPGGQNPLTRNLESNGPDVKIRGTAAHVAEKYMALARDAQSSGDPVLAENYLQHAEHYNRIIMAFRDQPIGQGDMPNGGQRFRGPNDIAEFGDDYDDDGDDMGPGENQPTVRMPHEPQPPMQPVAQRPYEPSPRGDDYRPQNDHDQNYGRNRFRPRHQGQRPQQDQHRHGQQRHDGGHRPPYQGHRPDRSDRPERHERPERHDRPERFDAPEPFERPERHDRVERVERVERHPEPAPAPEIPAMIAVPPPVEAAVAAPPAPSTPRAEREPAPARVRRDRFAQQPEHEQPEFLRRPVRRPRRDAAAAASTNGDSAEAVTPAAPAAPVDKT